MTPNQPKAAVICTDCGSSDIWRVAQRSGLIAFVMRHQGRKPYQCRACGTIYYRPGALQHKAMSSDAPPR